MLYEKKCNVEVAKHEKSCNTEKLQYEKNAK